MADTSSTDSSGYGSYYGAVADYFSQSGSTKSNGKAGGTSSSAAQDNSGSKSATGNDATQGGNASTSGTSWISAAVSSTESDKSAFTTNLSNWIGGISNNQIINSPNATGATSGPALAGMSGLTDGSGSGGAGINPLALLMLAFAGMALVLYAKGHG